MFPGSSRWSTGAEVEVEPAVVDAPRLALFGVRSCDLHAIAIHARVLAQRAVTDAAYRARGEATFVVALTCSEPGGTCFCLSMGTGPVPDSGFDLALTELLDQAGHRFLVVSGSDRAQVILDELRARATGGDVMAAGEQEVVAAREVGAQPAQAMGRSLDTKGTRDLLCANTERPQWDDVASGCLSCTNCTLVCPTCFCTSVEDVSDLTGSTTERWRVWDSCFTTDFSHLHGGSVRTSAKSRYRQWATHKLASWMDQFDASGCVGCGAAHRELGSRRHPCARSCRRCGAGSRSRPAAQRTCRGRRRGCEASTTVPPCRTRSRQPCQPQRTPC